jgi:hypothetical protein
MSLGSGTLGSAAAFSVLNAISVTRLTIAVSVYVLMPGNVANSGPSDTLQSF